MTILATQVSPVITGIITIRIMAEDGRRPAIGGVADVTLFRRGQMPIRLTGCTTTVVVMAAIAVPRGTGIVHPGAAYKGCRGMAEVTVQRGCKVRRDGINLAFRRITIVTGRTVIHNTGVIKHGTDKCSRVMTDTAILIGRYMGRWFSGCITRCVTGRTVIHNTGVVEGSRYKPCSLVTHMAVLVGRHMIGWRYLSRCRAAIVTGHTIVHDAGVIEMRTCKGSGIVTG